MTREQAEAERRYPVKVIPPTLADGKIDGVLIYNDKQRARQQAFLAACEWMRGQQWIEVSPENVNKVEKEEEFHFYSIDYILTDGIKWDKGYFDFHTERWITTIKNPTHYQRIMLPNNLNKQSYE